MRILILILIIFTLAACGQKGRLYLPTPDENPAEPRSANE
ncbi:MAG: lipoprotein [Dehalococcoidia bacterium]|nr:lipoprotein [Dehalococcoidia bacterium]